MQTGKGIVHWIGCINAIKCLISARNRLSVTQHLSKVVLVPFLDEKINNYKSGSITILTHQNNTLCTQSKVKENSLLFWKMSLQHC